MPTLGLIGLAVVLVLALFAALSGRASAAEPSASDPAPATSLANAGTPVPDHPLSKQELAERLKALSQSKPSGPMNPAAMCYKPAMPKDSAEYACPRCGERTQYSKSVATANLVTREVPAIRAALRALHGLDVSVDESALCRKCTPQAPAQPQVVLVVKHPDGSVQRTSGASAQDVRLLQEFVEGKLKHSGAHDEESPLKDHQRRIEELLGVPAAK